MPITKCECGSKDFVLDEGVSYLMVVDDKGDLNKVKVNDNTIDQIFCTKCYKGYCPDNFNEINFD